MESKEALLKAAGIIGGPLYLDRLYAEFTGNADEYVCRPLVDYSGLNEYCRLIDVPAEAGVAAAEAGRFIEAQSARKYIAAFIVYVLIDGIKPWENGPYIAPQPDFLNGDFRMSAYFRLLLVFIALARGVLQRQTKNFSIDYIKLPLSDVRFNIMLNYKRDGQWGADNLGWVLKSASQTMTRQGVFQCVPLVLAGLYGTAYKNIANGKTVFICEPGIAATKEGQPAPDTAVAAFITVFEKNGNIIRGNPVHPAGYIIEAVCELDTAVWKKALEQGDTVLELHIPADAPYDTEHFMDTFHKAAEFYGTYYPELRFKAVYCLSWLFSPQLADIIANPASRILAMQRQVYILPQKSGLDVFYEFIFGSPEVNIETIVCATSLQKKLAAYIRAGKPLNWGSFFYLTEDFERWGSEPYIRDYCES